MHHRHHRPTSQPCAPCVKSTPCLQLLSSPRLHSPAGHLAPVSTLASRQSQHSSRRNMASRKKVLLKVRCRVPETNPAVRDGGGPVLEQPTALSLFSSTDSKFLVGLGHYPRRQRCRKDEFDEPICRSLILPPSLQQRLGVACRPFAVLTRVYYYTGQQEVQRQLQGHDRGRLSHKGGSSG